MTKTRTLIVLAIVAAIAVTSGCSQKYSAERDGKKLGEAVCDLRNADSPDDVQEARDDIDKQLEDLGNKLTLFTAEDRADVQNNLADLAEHRIQGNTTLMQQDLTVLQQDADNISDDVNQTSQAAWDGFEEGLDDCTQ